MPRLCLLAALLSLGLAACDDGGGIVGTWEPTGADAPAARTTFFADGTARIVSGEGAGSEAFDARYTVQGDTVLTLASRELGEEQFRLLVAADSLVLESPATGMRTVFARVQAR